MTASIDTMSPERKLALWQAEESAVRARLMTVHGGRQVATAESRLFGPDDKLYAHASTTCLVFDQVS